MDTPDSDGDNLDEGLEPDTQPPKEGGQEEESDIFMWQVSKSLWGA